MPDFHREYFPEQSTSTALSIALSRVSAPVVAKVMAFGASGTIVTGMLLQMTGHELPDQVATPGIFVGGVVLGLLYYLTLGRIGSAAFDTRRRWTHRLVLGACFFAMMAAISYMMIGYLLTLLLPPAPLKEVYTQGFAEANAGLVLACVCFVLLLDTIVFASHYLELSDTQVAEPQLRQNLADAERKIAELEISIEQLESQHSETVSAFEAQIAAAASEAKANLQQALTGKEAELDRAMEVAMTGSTADLRVFRALWPHEGAVEARVLKESLGMEVAPNLSRLYDRGDIERIDAPASFQASWLWRAHRVRLVDSRATTSGNNGHKGEGRP